MTLSLESIRKLRDEGMKEEWEVPIESLPSAFQNEVEAYLRSGVDKGGVLTGHEGIVYSVEDGKVFQHPPTIDPNWEMIDLLIEAFEKVCGDPFDMDHYCRWCGWSSGNHSDDCVYVKLMGKKAKYGYPPYSLEGEKS